MACGGDVRTNIGLRAVVVMLVSRCGEYPCECKKDIRGKFARGRRSVVYRAGDVERGGSVVECRTRNRESPGSNPL